MNKYNWDGFFLRLTLFSSILACLFFGLVPLIALSLKRVSLAETLLLLPVEFIEDQVEYDVAKTLGISYNFITPKVVFYSVLSGVIWGCSIIYLYTFTRSIVYPIIFWIREGQFPNDGDEIHSDLRIGAASFTIALILFIVVELFLSNYDLSILVYLVAFISSIVGVANFIVYFRYNKR